MFENLNEQQKEAVNYINGPLLILAGAGSGKTRVLTTRICNLVLNHNVNPENILAITFTNKAAKEMKERVYKMLGNQALNIQISTFHSFGVTILKNNYKQLGYNSNFTILDADDSLAVIKRIMKDLNYDVKYYNPRIIRNLISSAKNEMVSPSEYKLKYVNDDLSKVVSNVYQRYNERIKNSNSLDFDDLLLKPLELFMNNKDILLKYQEQYKYILIDEYQDTNNIQYKLANTLAYLYRNICVVGDNDQSIYSFRGANYKNILNFENDYKDAKVILLEENYRSTKNILDVANSIIKHNSQRKDKNLWTNQVLGDKVIYHKSNTELDEAVYVLNEIKKLKNKGIENKDIAILYRTNLQSRILEEEFLKSNIPYKVIGSYYFYDRKEIKDLIAYLKLIYNPLDDISLTRIINVPRRGIGEKTIEKLTKKAINENKSLFDSITEGKELEFKNLILDLILTKDNYTITQLVDEILIRTKLKDDVINDLQSDIKEDYLEEFKSITRSFEEDNPTIDLGDFLDEITLLSDKEQYKNNTDVVSLMTVHNAKGLEFDYVFVVGMEENIFPHSISIEEGNIEEERRLCYVAITRACKKLWLTNTLSRRLFGNVNRNLPSRFIKEIPKDLLDEGNSTFKKENYYSDEQYQVGQHVLHNLYGDGIIIGMTSNILTIMFKDGAKTIMKGHKSICKVEE